MRGETLATRGEHGAQRPSEHRFRLAAARDCARALSSRGPGVRVFG